MFIEMFDWDEHNVAHIAQHDVTPDEVEEVFEARYWVKRDRDGRYWAFGQTATGRYLFIVIERAGPVGLIRVVAARDMEWRERKLYKRKL